MTATAFTSKDRIAPDSLELFDGSTVTLRLIAPDDRDALLAFHRGLSEKTIYMRYFSPVSYSWRTSDSRLADVLCNDPDHHLTLVAERIARGSGNREIIGIGRLVITAPHAAAEFAVTIADRYQGMGVGSAVLGMLVELARNEGLDMLTGSILPENRAMIALCWKLGFTVRPGGSGEPFEAHLDLRRYHSSTVQLS